METLVNTVLTGENLRTIVILVVIIGGFLLQNAKIDKRFVEVKSELKADIAAVKAEMDKRFVELRAEIDKRFTEVDKRFTEVDKRFVEVDKRFTEVDKRFVEVQAAFDRLKTNDFGHLKTAFKNLTYVLVKKELIGEDDKSFIDKALDD